VQADVFRRLGWFFPRRRSNAAQMVADAMESEHWPEVTGILAGSGTLFLATPRQEDQNRLLDRFRLFLKRSGPPGVDHAGQSEEPDEAEEPEEDAEEAEPEAE